MSNHGIRLTLRAAAVVALVACFGVPAAEGQTASRDDAGNNTVNVYLWGAGIQGDLSYPFDGESFSITLDQILDNLKMAGMVTYRRDVGDWSVLVDLIYLDEGASKSGTVTLPTEEGGTIDVDVNADVNLTTWVGGLYGGYTIHRTEASSHRFVFGVRYLSIDSDATIVADDPQASPLDSRSFSASGELWDGVIGFEGKVNLGGRWRLPYHLDIGTGSSKITYQALAGAALEFGWGNLSLTYRYLYFDEGNQGLVHDLTMDGPVMAVGFRF